MNSVREINILSLNIQGLNKMNKRKALLDLLLKKNIHIALLQETKLKKGIHINLDNLAKQFFIVEGRAVTSTRGTMILINKRINTGIIDIHFNSPRALIISLKLFGSQYVFLNLYAPNNPSENKTFLIDTLQKLNFTKGPIIIGGDFNNKALHSFKAFSICLKHLNLIDLALTTGLNLVPTRFDGKSSNTIDYIFLSNSLFNSLCHIGPTFLSDHCWIICVLKLNNVNSPIISIANTLHYIPHPEFPFNIQFYNQTYVRIFSLSQVDEPFYSWTNFKREFHSSLRLDDVEFRTQQNVRFNVANNILNKFIDFDISDIPLIISQKKIINSILDERNKLLSHKFIKNIIFNRDQINQLLSTRFFRKPYNDFSSLLDSSTVLFDQELVCKVLHHFSETFQKFHNPAALINISNFSCDIISYDDDNRTFIITDLVITQAFNNLNMHSAGGPDCFSFDLMNRFSHIFFPLLKTFYNSWISKPSFNNGFFNSYFILIPKRTDVDIDLKYLPSHPTINDLRPISISNIDAKIFAKILNIKFTNILINFLNTSQFAVAGRSIHTPLLILSEIFDLVKINKLKSYIILFLDVSKAFDKVNQGFLANKIIETCGYSNLTMGLLNYISNKTTGFKYNGKIFGNIKVNRGIAQGSPLSSNLFNLYLNDLLNSLEVHLDGIFVPSFGKVVRVMAYMDDLVVICSDYQQVEVAMKICNDFSAITGSEFNKSKSVALNIFHKTIVPKFQGAQPSSYLGLPFPFFGSVARNIIQKRISVKALSIVDKLKGKYLSLPLRVKIINNYLVPLLVYYMPHLNFTKTFFNTFFSWCNRILWPKKITLVSRAKLFKSFHLGGLGLIDISLLNKSVKANAFVKCFVYFQKIDCLIPVPPTDTPPPSPNKATNFLNNFLLYKELEDDLDLKQLSNIHYKDVKKVFFPYPNNNSLSCYWKTLYKNLNISFSSPNLIDFIFKITNRSLPTSQYLVRKFNFNISLSCIFCNRDENIDHLFFSCPFFFDLRKWILSFIPFNLENSSFDQLFSSLILNKVLIKIMVIILFSIWKIRNHKIFRNMNLLPIFFTQTMLREAYSKDLIFLPDVAFNTYWNNNTVNSGRLTFLTN